jgi:Domain of unknown function (DUF4262)
VSELSEFEQRIAANVEQYGCHVMSVFDPDGIAPTFSYSVGFPVSLAQPEVITFGLSSKMMHSMINAMYRQCRDGLKMSAGLRVSDLLDGYDCVLRPVKPEHIMAEHFGSAMWFQRHRTSRAMTEAFQIVWPGAGNGLFPWEEGASQDVIDLQPALYEDAA